MAIAFYLQEIQQVLAGEMSDSDQALTLAYLVLQTFNEADGISRGFRKDRNLLAHEGLQQVVVDPNSFVQTIREHSATEMSFLKWITGFFTPPKATQTKKKGKGGGAKKPATSKKDYSEYFSLIMTQLYTHINQSSTLSLAYLTILLHESMPTQLQDKGVLSEQLALLRETRNMLVHPEVCYSKDQKQAVAFNMEKLKFVLDAICTAILQDTRIPFSRDHFDQLQETFDKLGQLIDSMPEEFPEKKEAQTYIASFALPGILLLDEAASKQKKRDLVIKSVEWGRKLIDFNEKTFGAYLEGMIAAGTWTKEEIDQYGQLSGQTSLPIQFNLIEVLSRLEQADTTMLYDRIITGPHQPSVLRINPSSIGFTKGGSVSPVDVWLWLSSEALDPEIKWTQQIEFDPNKLQLMLARFQSITTQTQAESLANHICEMTKHKAARGKLIKLLTGQTDDLVHASVPLVAGKNRIQNPYCNAIILNRWSSIILAMIVKPLMQLSENDKYPLLLSLTASLVHVESREKSNEFLSLFCDQLGDGDQGVYNLLQVIAHQSICGYHIQAEFHSQIFSLTNILWCVEKGLSVFAHMTLNRMMGDEMISVLGLLLRHPTLRETEDFKRIVVLSSMNENIPKKATCPDISLMVKDQSTHNSLINFPACLRHFMDEVIFYQHGANGSPDLAISEGFIRTYDLLIRQAASSMSLGREFPDIFSVEVSRSILDWLFKWANPDVRAVAEHDVDSIRYRRRLKKTLRGSVKGLKELQQAGLKQDKEYFIFIAQILVELGSGVSGQTWEDLTVFDSVQKLCKELSESVGKLSLTQTHKINMLSIFGRAIMTLFYYHRVYQKLVNSLRAKHEHRLALTLMLVLNIKIDLDHLVKQRHDSLLQGFLSYDSIISMLGVDGFLTATELAQLDLMVQSIDKEKFHFMTQFQPDDSVALAPSPFIESRMNEAQILSIMRYGLCDRWLFQKLLLEQSDIYKENVSRNESPSQEELYQLLCMQCVHEKICAPGVHEKICAPDSFESRYSQLVEIYDRNDVVEEESIEKINEIIDRIERQIFRGNGMIDNTFVSETMPWLAEAFGQKMQACIAQISKTQQWWFTSLDAHKAHEEVMKEFPKVSRLTVCKTGMFGKKQAPSCGGGSAPALGRK